MTVTTAPRDLEKAKEALGRKCIAGVDEAGRGPLVGPVVAAACVVPAGVDIAGVTDSKALSEEAREAAFAEIMKLTSVGVGIVDHKKIDEVNILQATMLAMQHAVDALPCVADAVLIDGNRVPEALQHREGLDAEAIVKGDSRSFSIAAASIVAKVTRDKLMHELHTAHPEYGFDKHKGYPTAAHMASLHKHGPLPEHRYSFAPVAKVAAARGIVTDTYVDRARAAAAAAGSVRASKVKGKRAGAKTSASAAGDVNPETRGVNSADDAGGCVAAGAAETQPKKRGRPPKAASTEPAKAAKKAQKKVSADAPPDAPATALGASPGRVTRSRARSASAPGEA